MTRRVGQVAKHDGDGDDDGDGGSDAGPSKLELIYGSPRISSVCLGIARNQSALPQ